MHKLRRSAARQVTGEQENDGDRSSNPTMILTPQQVYQRLTESPGDVLLVDIRNPEEWLYDGRIDGATWIPMYELPVRAAREFPTDADVILYCAHGVRSHAMVRYLSRAGFKNVIDMKGGLEAWARAGLPVQGG